VSVRSELHERPTLFYGFRLRHVLALLVCLGLILILAGYFAVSAGQKASLESVRAQGRALTETLISSAEMLIETDNEITALAIENLIGKVETFQPRHLSAINKNLDNWRLSLDADRLSLVLNGKIVSSSVSRQPVTDMVTSSGWLDSLEIDSEAEIIYDFQNIDNSRYLFSYFPLNDSSGFFAALNWQYGQYGNEKLSLYNLLNEVGQESGVEYIMLQNLDGIIFASKKIASMPKLAEDPFLVETTKSDTTRSRLMLFQDREVMESARNFRAGDLDGVFRVGLSLYGYRQIIGGVKKQVWLVVSALIIVGMLAFGLIAGFQNYEFLRAGFHKANVISQSLLDSIPGPVVAIDSQKRVTDINAMARSRFGISQVGATSADYGSLFPDDPFHFKQVMQNQRNASFEKALGEDRRNYFVTTTPLVGFEGNSIGAIAVALDVTETRKLESMAESRRRLSELGALAASMAHEIRNPLNAIGMTIQRMKTEVKPAGPDEEYHKFIEGLRSEIKRLNNIIEKFLAIARSIRPQIELINVEDLVKEAVRLFENQARNQNTSLSWEVSGNIEVEGDKAGLQQVLINLIKNSLEALKEGGDIIIKADEIGMKVQISVTDNGPGIDDISAALKPFHTTKRGGTGLGLATASKIMADHGGELVIESSPGKGCRIDMLIPKGKVH
jgi:signal transduction histidine kinase